jgi:hypothetical protein
MVGSIKEEVTRVECGMSGSALGYIHGRLESERNVINIFGELGIASDLSAIFGFEIEVLDLSIESIAFVVEVL